MLKLIIKNKWFCLSTQKTKLFIVRHGQSQWNQDKKWGGWKDIRLSPKGIQQAIQCAKIIRKQNILFDEVYTSVLTRTILTSNYILDELDILYTPIIKSWRLNQKNYGALEGESKHAITLKYGQEKVKQWRRSINIRPPPLLLTDPRHPIHDNRYKDVPRHQLPSSQCLMDVCIRLKPLLKEIKEKLKMGKSVLIVTHGNVIRAFLLLIFSMNEQQLAKLNFPNATPIIINLDRNIEGINYQIIGDQKEIQFKMKEIQNETIIKKD